MTAIEIGIYLSAGYVCGFVGVSGALVAKAWPAPSGSPILTQIKFLFIACINMFLGSIGAIVTMGHFLYRDPGADEQALMRLVSLGAGVLLGLTISIRSAYLATKSKPDQVSGSS